MALIKSKNEKDCRWLEKALAKRGGKCPIKQMRGADMWHWQLETLYEIDCTGRDLTGFDWAGVDAKKLILKDVIGINEFDPQVVRGKNISGTKIYGKTTSTDWSGIWMKGAHLFDCNTDGFAERDDYPTSYEGVGIHKNGKRIAAFGDNIYKEVEPGSYTGWILGKTMPGRRMLFNPGSESINDPGDDYYDFILKNYRTLNSYGNSPNPPCHIDNCTYNQDRRLTFASGVNYSNMQIDLDTNNDTSGCFSTIHGAVFRDVKGCTFINCDLTGSKWTEPILFQDCKFIGCKLNGLPLGDNVYENTSFQGCQMDDFILDEGQVISDKDLREVFKGNDNVVCVLGKQPAVLCPDNMPLEECKIRVVEFIPELTALLVAKARNLDFSRGARYEVLSSSKETVADCQARFRAELDDNIKELEETDIIKGLCDLTPEQREGYIQAYVEANKLTHIWGKKEAMVRSKKDRNRFKAAVFSRPNKDGAVSVYDVESVIDYYQTIQDFECVQRELQQSGLTEYRIKDVIARITRTECVTTIQSPKELATVK